MNDLLDKDDSDSGLSLIEVFKMIWLEPTYVFEKTRGAFYTRLALILFVLSQLELTEFIYSILYYKSTFVEDFILQVLTGLAIGFTMVLICFSIGHAQNGKASFRQIIKVSGLSLIPTSCAAFFTQMPYALYHVFRIDNGNGMINSPSESMKILGVIISILVTITTIWGIIIFYNGLKVVEKFTTRQAIVNGICTYFIAAILMVVVGNIV